MKRVKRVLSSRTALTLGTWVAYALSFLPLYRLLGAEATALVMLPVIVTGWCFGTWGGLLAGLLGFLLDVLLPTLAVSRNLVQVNGGTIEGESPSTELCEASRSASRVDRTGTGGQGSTFTVRLPIGGRLALRAS